MSTQPNLPIQPNLTKYTLDEACGLADKYLSLLDEGKEDEAEQFALNIPIAPFTAQIEKERIGIKALIESGINLSRAVEEYGESWLKE